MLRLAWLALVGCSAIAVHSPATHTECTDSTAAPIIDTVLAAAAAVASAGLFMDTCDAMTEMCAEHNTLVRLPAALLLLPAAAFGVSAVYGYGAVHSCRSR